MTWTVEIRLTAPDGQVTWGKNHCQKADIAGEAARLSAWVLDSVRLGEELGVSREIPQLNGERTHAKVPLKHALTPTSGRKR